jgi:hypothetical protein
VTVADLLFSSLGHHAAEDESGDLYAFIAALTAPIEIVHELVRERDDAPGWAIAYNVDDAPAEFLPWLAQHVGVVLEPGMSESQQRNEIREPTGWTRGREPSIEVAAQRTLTGTKRVIIRPRTPEVGVHTIRTWLVETPDPARTEAVLRASLAAWELLEYQAVTGYTYTDVDADFADYAAVRAAFDDYRELLTTLP